MLDSTQTTDSTYYSLATATGKITILKSGRYIISGITNITAGTSGSQLQCRILINGSTLIGLTTSHASTTSALRISASTMYYLAAGSTIELGIFQDSGVNKTVSDEFRELQLCIARV